MKIRNTIEEILTQEYKPSLLEIIDESSFHKSHYKDANESHFKIIIHSKVFENKTMIAQHKMIYKSLEILMNNPIHALSLVTKAC